MHGVAALLVFVSLVLLGYSLSGWVRRRAEVRRAFDNRLETMTGGPGTQSRPGLLRDPRLSRIGVLHVLLGRLGVGRRFARMVRQAGIKRRPGEVLLYVPLLASIGLLLVLLISGSWVVGVGVGAGAAVVPLVVVRRRREKRARLFGEQLPDALDLIRTALQAGHGFASALQVVADEFPDPLAEEFRDVVEEIRLGLPLRDALYRLGDRVDDQNVTILATGVLVSQEVGGNLAEVLGNISHTIRERFKLLREVQVLTAQGRLSGQVLAVLPFLVVAVMLIANPAYFEPMIKERAGNLMLVYALVSIFWGHTVIQRLVKGIRV